MNRAGRRLDGSNRVRAAGPDPLSRMRDGVIAEWGVAEGKRLLRLSLDRIPEPGAFEGDYARALRDVIREEHPEWAAANLPEDL